MQALINDLLDYSRVGTHASSMQSADLNEIMGAVTVNLSATIDEARARVVIDERLPVVVGDVAQLTRLLQNLVSNAIKFHGDRVPEVVVGATRDQAAWTITVSDNGIGIEPRHAERIFMVFKRLHPSDEFPGTGIGLSVCRKIVERYGGRIWVESTPGLGSAFHFTLPDRPVEAAPAAGTGSDGAAARAPSTVAAPARSEVGAPA
jgi:light-regulated signal transduction histidine kinase (bacteriophytochrome)